MKRCLIITVGAFLFQLSFLTELRAALGEKQPPAPRLDVVYNNISIGAAPIWVTHEAGFFRKNDLDIALTFARGILATQAMVVGSFPIGFTSVSSVINADLAGARLRFVGAVTNRLIYAMVTAREITTASQLKGKKVGIARLGDASETATRFAARELGLDPDRDIFMLQIGNSPDRFAALSTGKIDGMIADPADVVRAKRQGFNVLIDLTTKEFGYHGNGIVMPESFIREKRETALKFLRAYVEGVHYYKTHPEESVRIIAAHLKTSDLDMLRQGWKVFTERLIPMKPYSSIKDIQLIVQEMATQNPAAKNAMAERFIDSSLIEEIDRSGFIDRLYR
ncbi:MAG TPA: ABC transporter substrate-binding protein [Candidatus Binatia bacterium]